MRSHPLLKVKNLALEFNTYRGVVKALDDVNFQIFGKERFGLAGETGCGKSVTALSILKLVPKPGRIVNGEIIFRGEDLLRKSQKEMQKIRGSKISMVFQDPTSSLNPVFKIGDQINGVIRKHQNLNEKEARERALELLEKVKLADPTRVLRMYPHELSGGMKQRVMIAIALSCHPDLLIADEPTTNVDVTIQAEILDLMRDLQRDFKSSILYITHNLAVIAETCDRVGIMYAGNIVEVGSTKDIFSSPLHPYTQGLIKAIPELGKREKKLSSIMGAVPDLINPPKGCKFHPRCARMEAICRSEKPTLTELEKGHYVACWNVFNWEGRQDVAFSED